MWSPISGDDICAGNWVCHTNGKCYKRFSSSKTWTAADTDCAGKFLSVCPSFSPNFSCFQDGDQLVTAVVTVIESRSPILFWGFSVNRVR